MMTILASYAQEESRSASENQKWRIKRSFESGIPWDRTLMGYRMETSIMLLFRGKPKSSAVFIMNTFRAAATSLLQNA